MNAKDAVGHTETCPSCGRESAKIYRCSNCGYDLTGDTTTQGGQSR